MAAPLDPHGAAILQQFYSGVRTGGPPANWEMGIFPKSAQMGNKQLQKDIGIEI